MKKNQLKKYLSQYRFFVYTFLLVLLLGLSFYAGRFNVNKKSTFDGFADFYNLSEREPIESDLLVGDEEDQQFLDETLENIFPEGSTSLSVEEQVIEIERFVVTYLKNKDNTGNASKILKDGYSICGGKSYVFRVLARKLNIPTRYVGFHYSPVQGGHDLSEVYYDKAWHLVDPTFGIFVYSNPEYDNKGRILSMAEIRKDTQTGYIQQVADKPWSGDYSQELKKYGARPLQEDYLFDNFGQEFNQWWRNEFKVAFPVVYGENSWISLPVDINLKNQDRFTIGEEDGSHIDMSIHDIRFKGFGVLGKSRDVPGRYNTVSVSVDTPQNVVIKYKSVKKYSDIKVVPLRSVVVKDIIKNKEDVTIKLNILDDPGIFLTIVPDGAFIVDAIEAFKDN